MTLYSTPSLSNRAIEEGELIFAVAVSAANILRDFRETITNTFGGRMKQYEQLTEETVTRALQLLEVRARDKGYDGVVGVTIAHPKIVEGGVEVVVYGTAFRYVA